MELFEVISEEEFQAETSVSSEDNPSPADEDSSEGTKVYCEFCKGYYYAEYHFGDREEVKS